jgi:hypothetical protein
MGVLLLVSGLSLLALPGLMVGWGRRLPPREWAGTLRSSTEPTSVKETPMAVKTTVKPATNSPAARSVRARAWRSPSSDRGKADT